MNNKQIIISIGREFGSGGHLIAEKIAQEYNLPLYDYNLLHEIAKEKDVEKVHLEKYDEIPRCVLFSRTVRGHSNSPEENIAWMQFDFLKKKAESGESFVVVGRCSEIVLKEYPSLIAFFILADIDYKIDRISKVYKMSKNEATKLIKSQNKKRKAYHNYYSTAKWGDSRNYEMSINCSKLGIEKTTAIIKEYIDERMKLL